MAVTPRETEEQWLLFVETAIETKKRKNALLVSNIVLFVYCIKATTIQLSVTIPLKVFTKLRGSSSLHWLSKADVGSLRSNSVGENVKYLFLHLLSLLFIIEFGHRFKFVLDIIYEKKRAAGQQF